MKRLLVVLMAVTVLAVGAPAPASAATTLTVPVSTSLTLSTGETVTVSGTLAVTVARFNVNDDRIVANATVNGSLTATTSLGTVTATFSNTKVLLKISNLQASCAAGTLSFGFRVVVPTSGVEVTVNGQPLVLKVPLKLSGTVAISTASIADESLAALVGQVICLVDDLLRGGASLDQVVAELNTLLGALAG